MGIGETIANILDKPGFDWKTLIIGFSTAHFIFESYLKLRQLKTVQKSNNQPIPPILKSKIDEETVLKSANYSTTKLKFSLFVDLYSLIQNLAFFKYDLLPKLWFTAGSVLTKLISSVSIWPKLMTGPITQSLIFMGEFIVLSTVLGLPIEYYQHFVVEEKFGFNKLSVPMWISDNVKSLSIGVVLGGPILAGFLKIIDYFGDKFMYYLTIFMFVVQIVMIIVYPKFIQPLFNKLTPLEDGELKTDIEKLAKQEKFPLDKLFVIDGSKRSSHSNAYFLGLPWGSKQIVIYDTLIQQSSNIKEVVAVLGHEIGHWFLSHTTKLLVINQVHIFGIFTMFAAFIHNQSLFNSFGFYNEFPILVGFMLFGDVLKPLDAVVSFAMNLLSRTYEYQADEYATRLGYGDELKVALINLHKENLSSMSVDWLYSAYSYNHPHLTERIEYIDKVEESMKGEKKE